MRKLASIRKIDVIRPIEGADSIELAIVGGWQSVVKRGEFKPGEIVVYIEVDSWVPHELAPFLSKGKEPREFNGVKGERLRTVKLRNQVSQGLLLKLEDCFDVVDIDGKLYMELLDHYQNLVEIVEELDVTEALGIQKWERPIPAQLAGMVRGSFPTEIPKTDQERCQNLVHEIAEANAKGMKFEITEKLEGSSCTFFMDRNGEFHVCSRNLDLKFDQNNSLWRAAIKYDVEQIMRNNNLVGYAIQGELVGPGIQGNIYGLSDVEFYIFDVYDVNRGHYLNPTERQELVNSLKLKHVPILGTSNLMTGEVSDLLLFADGRSKLGGKPAREGLVWKEMNGGMTFKTISNAYLLLEK